MLYLYSLINIAILYGALAVTQGILLNRLKLAFAGATVIAGLAAYFFASWENDSNTLLVALLVVFSVWLLIWFQDKLVGDYYLLASIALLEVLDTIVSSPAAGLGGREGLTIERGLEFSSSSFESDFLWISLPLALISILFYGFIFRSNLGVFIDRIGALRQEAERWINAKAINILVISICMLSFAIEGLIYLVYRGGISPSIFSLDMAFLLIIFTILSLRISLLGMLAALLYFTLPWLILKVTGLIGSSIILPGSSEQFVIDGDFIAELIRLVWGGAVVIIARSINIDGKQSER